jgi:hypothetical protein
VLDAPAAGDEVNIVAWRYRPTMGVDKFQWRLTEVPPWKWGTDLAIEQQPLYAKSPQDGTNSADVIAGLEMALAQAAAMIERQQHVMQRAMDAWDTTTHQKNGDGRLWQCMEELRGECGKQPNAVLGLLRCRAVRHDDYLLRREDATDGGANS